MATKPVPLGEEPSNRCKACNVALINEKDRQAGECETHCPCGHPLWAPTSIQAGRCESCKVTEV